MSEAESLWSVCPQCGKRLRLKAALAGKRIVCPSCSSSFMARADPGPRDSAPPPSATPPPPATRVPWALIGVASVSFLLVSVLTVFWFDTSAEARRLRDQLAHAEEQARQTTTAGEQQGADVENLSAQVTRLEAEVIKDRDRLLAAEKLAREAEARAKETTDQLTQERERTRNAGISAAAAREKITAMERKLSQAVDDREADSKLLAQGLETLKAHKYTPIPVFARGVASIQSSDGLVATGRGVVAQIRGIGWVADGQWPLQGGDVLFNVSRGTRVRVGEHELEPGECALYQLGTFQKLSGNVSPDEAAEKAARAVETAGGVVVRSTLIIGNPVTQVTLAKPTPAAVRELAVLKYLHTVRFVKEMVTGEVLRELAVCKNLGGLELKESEFRPADLKELAGVKRLSMLFLGGPQITDEAMAALGDLATRGGLERLDTLQLTTTKATGKGFALFAGLKHLRHLGVYRSPVNDEGVKEIARLAGLESLRLGGLEFTDAGMKEVAALKGVTTLSLEDLKVSDAGLKELAGMKQLRQLDVRNTEVTVEGLKHLTGLTQLASINLRGTFTKAEIARLQSAFPRCFLILEGAKE